jgi:hypothetical protein
MKLLGHFLTFLIAITVAATGGYYLLQQSHVKQLEIEMLQKSFLSMEDDINRLRQNLVNQQATIKQKNNQLDQQFASHVKDIKTLASNVDKLKAINEHELKNIKETLTSFQKAYKSALVSLREKSQKELHDLFEQTKTEIHDIRKDHIKIIKSLQKQIILLTDRHVEKNELPKLFSSAFTSYFTSYRSVNADLGSLPSGQPGKITKEIPTNIPNEAQEILIYAYIATSYVRGGKHSFKISVKPSESQEAAFYLYSVANMQQAWSYNSDNVWLPMPNNRKIFLETTGSPLFGSWDSRVKIIAYR